MGIDPVSPTFDRDVVRQKIRLFNDFGFLQRVKAERCMEIYENPRLRRIYFDERRNEITKLTSE